MWVGGHRIMCSKTLAQILAFLMLDVQCLQAVLTSPDDFRRETKLRMCPGMICLTFHAHLGNGQT